MPVHHVHRHYLFEKILQIICFNSDHFVPGEERVTVTLAGVGGGGGGGRDSANLHWLYVYQYTKGFFLKRTRNVSTKELEL